MHSVHAALLLYSEDLGRLEYITLKNTKVLLDVYNKLIGFFFSSSKCSEVPKCFLQASETRSQFMLVTLFVENQRCFGDFSVMLQTVGKN